MKKLLNNIAVICFAAGLFLGCSEGDTIIYNIIGLALMAAAVLIGRVRA